MKLTDFGIGQVVSQEALAGMTRMGFTQTMVGPGSSSHTGTQMYMAPELIAGQAASSCSDIYSLGVVLYQLLVGDFARPLTTDWTRRVDDPLLRDDLERCFAGDPKERFANAGELAQNLRLLGQRRAQRAKVAAAAARRTAIRRAVLGSTVAVFLVAFLWLSISFIRSTRNAPTVGSGREPASVVDPLEDLGTEDEFAKARYREGRNYLHRGTAKETEQAIQSFLEATKRDTNFAMGFTYLAAAYVWKEKFIEPGKGWATNALAALETAFRLKDLPEAHAVRGDLFFTPAGNWDAEGAVREFQRALNRKRNLASAHEGLTYVYVHCGFVKEAITEGKLVLNLDSQNNLTRAYLGQAYEFDKQYTNALREYENQTADLCSLVERLAAWVGQLLRCKAT